MLREEQGAKDGEVTCGASGGRSFSSPAQLQPSADMSLTFNDPPFRMCKSGKIVQQVGHLRIIATQRPLAQLESPPVDCGSIAKSARVLEHDAQTVDRCSEQHRIARLDFFRELNRSPVMLFRFAKTPE